MCMIDSPFLDIVGQERRSKAVAPDFANQVDHPGVGFELAEQVEAELPDVRPVPEVRFEGGGQLVVEFGFGDAAALELEERVLAGLLSGFLQRLAEILGRDADLVLKSQKRLVERGGEHAAEVGD